MRRFLGLVKIVSALSVVVVLVALVWLAGFALTPVSIPEQAREFSIKPGRSVRGVARDLVTAGVFQEPTSFVWMARMLGQANAIKAGNYQLPTRATPYRLLEMIARGEVMLAQITLIEGWTFPQVRRALAAHGELVHDSATLETGEILRRIGASEPDPEGLFFPDTYHFSSGASDLQILARAYHEMQARLDALWQGRARDLPYATPYEALIMASIVEKETALESERSMIAAVFVNRLKRGMRLQTDPTVIFGLGGAFDGNLRKRDLETDNPYNTYTRGGLPPTPIAMPGQAALEAALRPAPSTALYFVARGDGTSHFSNSLDDHNRAVQKYQIRRQ